MTQLGVVSIVDILPAPVHGYIHGESGWVLHARYPDKEKDNKRRRENKVKDKLLKKKREFKGKMEYH